MDQLETSGAPPALPPRRVETATKNEKDQDKKTMLYTVGAAIASIIFGIAWTSPKLFVGFVLGSAASAAAILGGVYYFLNLGVAKTALDKQKEVEKKLNQPHLEGKALPGADLGGFLQVLKPNANVPADKWMWGDLKQNMLFYQDLKGQSKGVIALANARMTVIKTKAGRLWRPQNYIRLVNPDRALLGEFRECVLFFRNSKEMEEWYLALRVATNLHEAKALAAQSARREHYTSIYRAIGYNWQAASLPMLTRPTTVSPMPGETSASSGHTHHTNPILNSWDDNDVKTKGTTPTSANGNIDAKWVNMLAHRVWNFLHNDPGFVGLVKKEIGKKLAKIKKPKMMTHLALKGIEFGNKLPIASNISVRSADPDGNLRLDADISYHGDATVELDLVIEVEILGKKFATIPVSIKAVIKTIVGRIQLAFSAPPSDVMWLGFYTEPHIELDIDSFIGEKHRLVNIPQLATIMVNKLRQEIVEMMLMPDMDDWPLPHLKVPHGESREKFVAWEYAAGYTPPPKIRTEFDSSSDEEDAEAQEIYRYNEAKQFISQAAGPTTAGSSNPLRTLIGTTDVPLVGMKKNNGHSPTQSQTSPQQQQPQQTHQQSSTTSQQSSRSSAQTTFSSDTFASSKKPLPSVPTTTATHNPSQPPKLPPKPASAASSPIATRARKSTEMTETSSGKSSSSPPQNVSPPTVHATNTNTTTTTTSSPPNDRSFPAASFTPIHEVKPMEVPQSAKPPNAATQSAASSTAVHRDPMADDKQKSEAEVAEDKSLRSESESGVTTPKLETPMPIAPAIPLFAPEPGTVSAVQPSGPITVYETLAYANEEKRRAAAAGASPDELLVKGTQHDVNHTLHIPVGGGSPTLFTVPDETNRDSDPDSPAAPLSEGATGHVRTRIVENFDAHSPPDRDEDKSPLAKSAAGVLTDASYDPLLRPDDCPSPAPLPKKSQEDSIKTISRDSSGVEVGTLSSMEPLIPTPVEPTPIVGIVTDITDVPTSLDPPEEDDWISTLPGAKSVSKSSSNSSVSSSHNDTSNTENPHNPFASSPPKDLSPLATNQLGDRPMLPPREISTNPPSTTAPSASDPFGDIFAGSQNQTPGFHAALHAPPQLPARSKSKSSTSASSPPHDSTAFPSGIYAANNNNGNNHNREPPKSWSSTSGSAGGSSSSASSKPSSNKEKRSSTSVKESFLSFIDSIKEKIDE